MKKRKADTTKKSEKKQQKKELQNSISQRFLDVVHHLGHDADKIAKDLKKIAKDLAEKLSKLDKAKDKKVILKKPVEILVAKAEEKGLKKRTGRVKAEKVVAKVVSRKTKPVIATEEKPVLQVPSVATPEPVAKVTRTRRKTAVTEPVSETSPNPASKRGRKPVVKTPGEETKPVVKRVPRKKAVAPVVENKETQADTDTPSEQ